ncbi:DUF1295 domain-containing protein [Leekyejoonella antrihumi]|uniref:DUF1295 domain-containing protein n=1 Tax=Leekyejoonella antrihumi TaxID=1660198 RepID=A0A563E3C5_9MICO|nr:DUF1295 domain-containing protein [Leekyejoonella antrihumi]TWP36394.1 DUF1295 domain-containing protein [Leekyejoonella antrihumi]
MGGFLALSGACFALLVVLQSVTCVISLRAHRFRIVDQVWGSGLALVSILCALIGTGDLPRRILLAIVVTVWGARLTAHIARRARGTDEDPRYAELVAGKSAAAAAGAVFGIQCVAQWFISLPIQVAACSGPPSGLAWLIVSAGGAVAVAGMVVESIADRQLKAFKADHDIHGCIMDQGLWGWSRHPNYFGDALVWVGVYLVAVAVWPGPLTVLSPAAMVWFLVVATGARRLERHLASRPGYAAYQERTSFFVPRPPDRSRITRPTPKS